MKTWFVKNKYILWYAFCFFLLGIIDQRNGSASGRIQMVFTNLTGFVVAGILIPSMDKAFFKWKGFKIWTVSLPIPVIIACIIGDNFWPIPGQWYTAVLNIALISGMILYIVWNKENVFSETTISWPLFSIVMVMLLLMCLSVHKSYWPLWFLGLFGSAYLIGIPKERWDDFFVGMPIGLVVWFFVQQIVAFALRPYDYVRYRGMYNSETPNGYFYMIVFCAFLCLWIWKKNEAKNRLLRILCFILAAGCVSFVILTGGRSSLIGVVAAGMVGIIGYDIIFAKSFKHWLLQGVALGMCALLLLPLVYGCVRYLPTVLHHPIWFEGDYDAENSVHSFDPWDSEKYVSFNEMIYADVGRILQMFGIRVTMEAGEINVKMPFALDVQAAEPGSSPDNPFVVSAIDEEEAITGAINVRKIIYLYVLKHLNFAGHESEGFGFWINATERFDGHAHNAYLQVAYNYGIMPGLLFLLWNACCFVRLSCRKDILGLCAAVFMASIIVCGCTEATIGSGKITLTMLFVLYYFGMQRKNRAEVC